jgi:group I intron endonuclease
MITNMRIRLIYIIRNKISKKIYIGSTTKLDACSRFAEHIKESRSRCKTALHKAIKSYGHDNFEITEICSVFTTQQDLWDLEDYFIDYYNSMSPNGYNLVYAHRGIDSREHISVAMKKEWTTNRESRLESIKNRKIDPEREKNGRIKLNKILSSPENKKRASEHFKKLWESGIIDNSESMKAEWAKPEKRVQRIKAMRDGASHRFRPVVAVSIIDGSVRFFENVCDTRRAGFSASGMYESIKGICKTSQKHCWFYKTTDDESYYKEQALSILGSFKSDWARPIIKIDPNTLQEMDYANIQAVKVDGFQPKQVARVLRGERKIARGFIWKFKNT